MARLNIGYDLLTYEGDILRLKFWAHAFDILKAQGAVFLQTEGKLAGCWVMRIDEGTASEAGGDDEAGGDEPSREKVIVRSNGVVTYVGKDIANQFWKFGLLGKDFLPAVRRAATGHTLWRCVENGNPGPRLRSCDRIFNVIDSASLSPGAPEPGAPRAGHP